MHQEPNTVPVRIAFIGGGSLNWAMQLMADLAYDQHLDAEVRLYDIDQAAAHRNAQIGAHYAAVSRGTPARYVVSDTLADALHSADIIVISILPGRFTEMAQDLGIPARYGIPQAVGDTVGPGGFVRALRAIPMLHEIGLSIAEHAPDAYVCNLTNPMSILTGTLYAAFPDIKAWGECHEVTKVRKQVAWIANQELGEERYTHRDVEAAVAGINHFTFVTRLAIAGRDMMPSYLRFAERYRSEGWAQAEPSSNPDHARYFGSRNLVAFDLLARLGVPAAAGDRHLAEFLPASDYLDAPERWGFALTPVEHRLRDRDFKLDRAEQLRNGQLAPTARRSDEAIVDQIIALKTGAPFISNVNLPNMGQMQGLPLGAVVETNAAFSGLGISAMHADPLPDTLNKIVSDHATRQSGFLQAALASDRHQLFELFRTDPLVSTLTSQDAHSMFQEMLLATQEWLPTSLKGAA